jgi:hypothetical protein
MSGRRSPRSNFLAASESHHGDPLADRPHIMSRIALAVVLSSEHPTDACLRPPWFTGARGSVRRACMPVGCPEQDELPCGLTPPRCTVGHTTHPTGGHRGQQPDRRRTDHSRAAHSSDGFLTTFWGVIVRPRVTLQSLATRRSVRLAVVAVIVSMSLTWPT